MIARLISLNVGAAGLLTFRRGTVSSAIVKTPVRHALRLSEAGLAGDTQAERRVHGGPDKAVCVFPLEHYAYFADRLGQVLALGAFGENFTLLQTGSSSSQQASTAVGRSDGPHGLLPALPRTR